MFAIAPLTVVQRINQATEELAETLPSDHVSKSADDHHERRRLILATILRQRKWGVGL